MSSYHAYAVCRQWDADALRFRLKPFAVAWALEPLKLGGPAFSYKSVMAPVHAATWDASALTKARKVAESDWRMLVGIAPGVTPEGHSAEVHVDGCLSVGELSRAGSVYALAKYLRPGKTLSDFPARAEIPLRRVTAARSRVCSPYREALWPENFTDAQGHRRMTVGDVAAARIFIVRCARGGYGILITKEPRWALT